MDGIIVVNKQKNMTSFDVIRELRKILKTKKIGHTGTLDPLAQGVLIICVGRATKLASYIEAERKTYIADVDFGYETDTYDKEGTVTNKSDVIVKEENLKNILNKYIGNILQEPPMYSAIKINGEKLYNLARKGIEVERKKRNVTAYNIELLEFDNNHAKILCEVSKGFYIRSLIHDVGRDLKSFATMTDLVRINVGNRNIESSYTLDDIKLMCEKQNYDFFINLENIFDFEKIYLTEDKELKYYQNGNIFKLSDKTFKNLKDGNKKVYYKNKFLGLGILNGHFLKPWIHK